MYPHFLWIIFFSLEFTTNLFKCKITETTTSKYTKLDEGYLNNSNIIIIIGKWYKLELGSQIGILPQTRTVFIYNIGTYIIVHPIG